jgi:hypothetical protein
MLSSCCTCTKFHSQEAKPEAAAKNFRNSLLAAKKHIIFMLIAEQPIIMLIAEQHIIIL